MKRLTIWILCSVLFCVNVLATEELEIIEHSGDRYVINVDALKPDKEMTLMDVLLTCPELVSDNGKRLNSDFEIRIDNVVLPMDDETILDAFKANEINTIEIYLSTSTSTSGAGRLGTIDIYFKEQEAGATSGKALLNGGTLGNGKIYADVVTKTGNITLRGYALTNLQHSKGSLTDYEWFSSRRAVENVHVNIDWDISKNDNLRIKMTQGFQDSKDKIFEDSESNMMEIPEFVRDWSGVASYTRTLNDNGATLLAELGADYANTHIEGVKMQDCFVYHFTETSIPCLNNALNILAGWEIDYLNSWTLNSDRQQIMYNDIYLQLDYKKGPWVLALGDRFRIINLWHRTYYDGETPHWKHNDIEHGYLASAGYKTGRHFVQGLFSRDYVTPLIYNYYAGYDEILKRAMYLTNTPVNMLYTIETRYTYQQADLVASGGVVHSWTTGNAIADERYTGIRASVTWRKGPFRLTAGADFYHGTLFYPNFNRVTNIFNVRLIPSLQLKRGLRISSKLLYNSRRQLLVEVRPHLYASVKVSKDLGRHCTVSADFHDIAGSPKMSFLQLGSYYDSRAVTFGFTYQY